MKSLHTFTPGWCSPFGLIGDLRKEAKSAGRRRIEAVQTCGTVFACFSNLIPLECLLLPYYETMYLGG